MGRAWGVFIGILSGLVVACIIGIGVVSYQNHEIDQRIVTLDKNIRAYDVGLYEVEAQAVIVGEAGCKAEPNCKYTVPELTVKITGTKVIVTVKKKK